MKDKRTYRTWKLMKCKGITICGDWMEFENFYRDMGKRPKKKTIDRKDLSKGYYKENCYWATKEEKTYNRRNNRHLKSC